MRERVDTGGPVTGMVRQNLAASGAEDAFAIMEGPPITR
jgi:hypothetical protein